MISITETSSLPSNILNSGVIWIPLQKFFELTAMRRSLPNDEWSFEAGCKDQALIQKPIENVVIDELYCLQRVTDRLQDGIISL